MKNYPNQLKERSELSLRHGIKSSLKEMKELFALTFALYLSHDCSAELIYSQENQAADGIEITPDATQKLKKFFSHLVSQSSPDLFSNSLNMNPLFSAQIEHLQVVLELFWKIGKVTFVEDLPFSQERTGNRRFVKKLSFSTNFILLKQALTDFDGRISQDLKNLLFNWLVKSQMFPENPQIAERIRLLLTIFSEETQFKIRTAIKSELYFQQEGIYQKLLQDIPVTSQDAKEAVGPLRILKSFVSSSLHKYLEEDAEHNFILKSSSSTEEFAEYVKSVETFLNLMPKRTTVICENDALEEFEVKVKNKQVIYYGAPGTGKSHKVESILQVIPENRKERVSFHPEYDHLSFVGGYKPFSELNRETGREEIKYKFVPQVFTNIYLKAWKDLSNQYFLAIEEINRGNCAEIFGDIFQLLDRKYSISPAKELKEYLRKELGENHLGIKDGKLRLPDNLIILATMNTSDQSLFPMDSAFKRRWNWEYIPIEYEAFYNDGTPNESFIYAVEIGDRKTFRWIEFIKKINNHIKQNANLGMDKCLGNYFVKPEENLISLEEFVQKVIFYLWNDVFRDEENPIFDEQTFYEDFFPIKTKGLEKVVEIIQKLEIQITDENPQIPGLLNFGDWQ